MITVNKANPTPGEITSSLTGSTGDGSGLHFDGSAGGINLGNSMPDLGSKYSLEFVVKGDARTGEVYLLDAYNSSSTNRVILAWSGNSNGNIQLHVNGTWSSAFIATPDNGEVLHLLLCVDGTSATLYQNGNSVSTQTVVANTLSGATNTHIGASQNGSGNFFNGTIYRARFYNRTLSADDVRTAFERADVPFADQYGRQAVTDGSVISTTNWTNGTGWTFSPSNKATYTTGSGAGALSQTGVFTSADAGKNVRLTFTLENISSGSPSHSMFIGNAAGGTAYVGSGYISYTAGTHTAEFTMPSGQTTLGFWANGATFTISNISVHVEGAVVDLDLAFANPSQSLTVQDRSTNNVDGTASSSTAVTQVQKLVQVNATAARIGTSAATPADGTVHIGDSTTTPLAGADDLIIARGSGDAGVTIRTATSSTGQICFADGNTGNEAYRGFIGYAHGTDKLNLGSGGSTAMSIDSSGLTTLTAGSNGVDDETLKLAFDLSGTSTVMGSIGTTNVDASNGGLTFKTVNGGTLGERLSISSAGDITSTNATGSKPVLTLENTKNDANSSQLVFNKNRTATNDDILGTVRFKGNNNAGTPENIEYATIYAQSSTVTDGAEDGKLIIRTMKDGTLAARLTIASNGVAEFSGGISFSQSNSGATGAAATSQILDHYEEGTWTCTLGGASSVANTTAYYTRIGDIVNVWYYSGSMSSDGSAATISGLPFAVSGAAYGGFFCFHNTYAPTANSGYFSVNTNTGNFTAANATATASSASATGRYLMFTGVYKVA
jgi:hypothetical protein